jgi:sugar lactone lactonase YvrE
MLVKRLLCLFWVFFPLAAMAQSSVPYVWEAGDLVLSYPADWTEPRESRGRLILRETEAEIDGVPTIILMRGAAQNNDLYTELASAFDTLGIIPTGPLDAELTNAQGVSTSGRSADGILYGMGRIARLPDNSVLQVVGTAAATERDAFSVIFNAIADSISLGASSTPRLSSTYGVLWQATQAEGETFTTLTGLVYADDTLYTVDSQLGIIKLDAQTGEVLDTFRPNIITAPSDLVVGNDGTIYVADLACACVVILTAEGEENGTLGGFSARDHLSVAVSTNGRIITADDNGIQANGRVIASVAANTRLALDNDGRVLALSPDGAVWVLENDTLVPLLQINNLPPVNDFAVDRDNHLVLATAPQGVLIYDLNGQQIGQVGRVVPSFPLPGEVVSPTAVAVSPAGTIYWVDSSTITAMSTQVQTGAAGTGMLTFGIAVQGLLNAFTPQQTWVFEGAAGQIVTLTAIDASADNTLDVALRLLAPTGSEEAFNDDHASGDLPARSDAQILAHTLQTSGVYFVRVERVSGEGTYTLGVGDGVLVFDLSADGVTELQGELQEVFPIHRWAFVGRAGQVFTITMMAESGDLDPLLRLRDASGNVLAENDDAADSSLGLNAQLLQVALPADGPYTVEAVRFAGTGRYRLVIVTTSP